MSREDCYKRITLLPEAITADMRVVFKVLFHKIMDSLTYREAVDIYSRSCYKLTENCESGSERYLLVFFYSFLSFLPIYKSTQTQN